MALHAWLELCDERQLSDTCQFLWNVVREKLFEVTPQRLLDVCDDALDTPIVDVLVLTALL